VAIRDQRDAAGILKVHATGKFLHAEGTGRQLVHAIDRAGDVDTRSVDRQQTRTLEVPSTIAVDDHQKVIVRIGWVGPHTKIRWRRQAVADTHLSVLEISALRRLRTGTQIRQTSVLHAPR